jgi:hypothetical protein
MSKIRHIQEANLKLEKRLLKEDDVTATSAANVNSAGKGLTPQEKQELSKFLYGLFSKNGNGILGFRWLLNSKSEWASSTYSPLVLTKSDINIQNIWFADTEEFQYGKPLVYSLYWNRNPIPIKVLNFTPTFRLTKIYKGIFVDI